MPLVAIVTTLKHKRSSVVIDVSATGARLQGPDLPRTSEELFVTVDGIIAFGVVAWEAGEERGIAFDPPLDAEDERILRERAAQSRGLTPEMSAALDDWSVGFAR